MSFEELRVLILKRLYSLFEYNADPIDPLGEFYGKSLFYNDDNKQSLRIWVQHWLSTYNPGWACHNLDIVSRNSQWEDRFCELKHKSASLDSMLMRLKISSNKSESYLGRVGNR